MNIKKSLAQLIVLSMFFTGCSNYQVKSESITQPNQATIQQTMTKVQNDNNEIINKNYEYVLSNLGEPNITTYWADSNDLNSLQDISDLSNLKNIDLLYFKNISNNGSDSSALYIGLKNEIVKKVQSIDYTKQSFIDDFYKSKVAIDYYRDYDTVELSNIKTKQLGEFVGANYSKYVEIVGNSQCMYDAYINQDGIKKSVELFKLDDEDKILCLFSENDEIIKVEVINNSEIKNEIQDILLKK